MTRFHDPTQAHAAGRPSAIGHDSGDAAVCRSPVPPRLLTTETLAEALRAQALSATSALARGASARALAMSQWCSRAPRRARLLDTVIGSARHHLAGDWPERTCANIWVRRVAADVLPGRTDPARAALERIVGTCIPVARALARARLALHMHPTGRAAVLERLDRLCAALGEDRTAWHLPVARLPVLEALPEAGWRGLERAPAWAVVRALGETAAPGPDYLRDLETLAQDLGRWAEQHALAVEHQAAALRARIDAGIENEALGLLARWLLELDGDPPGGPGLADAKNRASRALEQMRTLWAAEPCLAPRGRAAALRLGPETPSAHRPAETSRPDGAVRPRRLLVWRVPCTSPERAIVGNCGLSGLRLALAKPVSFELCTHSLDTPVVLRPTPAHACPKRTVRAEAVERIVERVAECWGP